MFPWEHVLFAYIFYSAYVHLRYRSRPTDRPVAALLVGSLLPDVIDKPLAWQLSLFDTGWGIAHSVFVAVAVSAGAYAVARRRDVDRVGAAFGVGYLLHLVGDVVPASLSRGRLYAEPVLWPFGNPQTRHDPVSFADGVRTPLSEFAAELLALDPSPVLVLQLGTVVLGVGLWLADGRPGLELATELLRGLSRSTA